MKSHGIRQFIHIIAALIISTGVIASDELPNQKDIKVFKNILTTMLDLGDQNDLPFMDGRESIQTTYLKNQGLLIEVDSRYATKVHFLNSRFHIAPSDFRFEYRIPSPPRVPSIDADEIEARVAEELERVEERLERQLEAEERSLEWLEEEREFLKQDLLEELKQKRHEQSELRQQLREELRALKEKAASKEIDKERIQEEIEKQQAEIKAQLESYKVEIEKMKQEHQKNWGEQAEKIQSTVIEALCQYGATIRNVKADEYFTLVLKGFEPAEEDGRRSDRVYVFSRSQVLACRDGSLTQEELLRQAETYTVN